jgi:hypothetical protein
LLVVAPKITCKKNGVQGSTAQKNTNQEYQQLNKEQEWGEQQMNNSNNKQGQMYLKKRSNK